jgi:hypothetical protein
MLGDERLKPHAFMAKRAPCCSAPAEGSWLARTLARKPRILVATALANSERRSATGPSVARAARSLWAMMMKQEEHRDPALV